MDDIGSLLRSITKSFLSRATELQISDGIPRCFGRIDNNRIVFWVRNADGRIWLYISVGEHWELEGLYLLLMLRGSIHTCIALRATGYIILLHQNLGAAGTQRSTVFLHNHPSSTDSPLISFPPPLYPPNSSIHKIPTYIHTYNKARTHKPKPKTPYPTRPYKT